jgi:hypothetical protein
MQLRSSILTGSGMLMALESGELASSAIGNYLNADRESPNLNALRLNYTAAYERVFDSRLKVCSLLRKAAFVPGPAELAILFLALVTVFAGASCKRLAVGHLKLYFRT